MRFQQEGQHIAATSPADLQPPTHTHFTTNIRNPMKRISYWKADQEIHTISYNPLVHYRVHKSHRIPLSQTILIQSTSSHLHLDLPSGLFPSYFPSTIFVGFLIFPKHKRTWKTTWQDIGHHPTTQNHVKCPENPGSITTYTEKQHIYFSISFLFAVFKIIIKLFFHPSSNSYYPLAVVPTPSLMSHPGTVFSGTLIHDLATKQISFITCNSVLPWPGTYLFISALATLYFIISSWLDASNSR